MTNQSMISTMHYDFAFSHYDLDDIALLAANQGAGSGREGKCPLLILDRKFIKEYFFQ